MRAGWRTGVVITTITVMAIVVWTSRDATRGENSESTRPHDADAAVAPADDDRTVTNADRDEALARAQIWIPPSVPVAAAYFGVDPAYPARADMPLQGQHPWRHDAKVRLSARKRRDGPRQVPVRGGEIPAETATSALLRALGFGADEVHLVQRLRCYGCPDEPFLTMKATELTGSASLYERSIDFDTFKDFEWVSIERKLPAPSIETEDIEGWGFFELEKVDSAKGGAARVRTSMPCGCLPSSSHTGTTSQRISASCVSRRTGRKGPRAHGRCCLLHDVGATFGPRKLDLDVVGEGGDLAGPRDLHGLDARVAARRRDVSRNSRPRGRSPVFGPATFAALRTSAHRLVCRRPASITTVGRLNPARPVGDWVRVFKQKVTAITEGPPCP